ncbi:MAG: COX15/CtaA family protein [Yaniella sp.]|uniref:COX15/CtaA family protein n=1 Tax=Yaniella sp. TaxID=2773929 RepID=UPI00264702CE|nr:COX15/CtaA family protein [Yaniella sp.]MDN5730624.1 COX15/CtaA family protein [Yaniella sp.]MDN5815334.1 COX15/CtaA family protein [Yaniella sp.]MDN5817290.1 COX15/CtaA family protein [Yaniella sp.]MDN5837536.1 COX15/CtaA family protein [Yaniella sp.]MDN5889341.1 COX15/CtaA family protein [Yaniella sp.]
MTTTGDQTIRRWSDVLMPRTFTLWTMVLAVASVISQAGIIVTGGAVRLTASGLGCSEWPRCTPDSYVTTPEMGINGAIEFGNRLLTFILAAIAVLTILALWRLRKTHGKLFGMSLFLMLVIPAQAVIGGITVWTDLNPWVVMLHFLVSALMVSIATLLAYRIGAERRARLTNTPALKIQDGATTSLTRSSSIVLYIAGWFTLVMGTIVTGSGPHGGDPTAPRHDFDQLLVTRLHAAPVYLMVALTVVLLVVMYRIQTSARQRRAVWTLTAVLIFQGLVGFYQHLNDLPIGAVWLHMFGIGLVTWAMTVVMDVFNSKYETRPTQHELAPDDGQEALTPA